MRFWSVSVSCALRPQKWVRVSMVPQSLEVPAHPAHGRNAIAEANRDLRRGFALLVELEDSLTHRDQNRLHARPLIASANIRGSNYGNALEAGLHDPDNVRPAESHRPKDTHRLKFSSRGQAFHGSRGNSQRRGDRLLGYQPIVRERWGCCLLFHGHVNLPKCGPPILEGRRIQRRCLA
jgi:hypothetical protein